MGRDWQTLVDRLLEEARQEGKFDRLPGGGKPLNLNEDPYTPSDLRLAHKILKEHDLAPEWMMLGKDIDAMRERLRENMQKGARAYRGALADAERSDRPFDKRQQAERTWARAKEAYGKVAAKLNGEIARYNLKVPQGINQKALFNLERELVRLLGERH